MSSYRVNRALGYQPWGVTNPWVFANLSQPTRLRGQVSPMVFKTHGPTLWNRTLPPQRSHHYLGDEAMSADERRSRRMETYAIIGVTLSATSLFLLYMRDKKQVRANRRRRRRR